MSDTTIALVEDGVLLGSRQLDMGIPAWYRLWALGGVARALGVGVLAGTGAGLIALGVGSRIAMRIAAVTTGSSCAALVTENGNLCGEITVGGTLLLLLLGALFGTPGGVVYVAMRPWLTGLGRWSGLAFGFLLLAAFGSIVIEGNNPDFRLFATPVVNIIIFAVLFPLFGLLVAPLANWLDRSLPGVPPRRPLRRRTVAAYALTGFATLTAPVPFVGLTVSGLVGGLDEQTVHAAVGLFLVVVIPANRILLNRWRSSPLLGASGGARIAPVVASYAILAAPIFAGLALTVQAFVEIL